MIRIVNWQELDRTKLSSFIERNGRVFQRISYLSAHGHFLKGVVAIEDDEILGSFLYFNSIKFRVKGCHIPSYTHVFGPVIKKGLPNSSEVIESIIASLGDSNLIELKIDVDDANILPYIKNSGRCIGTQTHRIEADVNFNEGVVHSSKRRYLKKLLKLFNSGELQIREGNDALENLLELQRKTAHKSGFNAHLHSLERIVKGLNEEEYFAFVLLDPSGNPISGAFCPFDKEYAYHIINASIQHDDKLLNRSNVLTTYLAIKKALSMGRGFDFEGSNVPGVAEFYRQMGGVPVVFYRIQIAKSLLSKLYFSSQMFRG